MNASSQSMYLAKKQLIAADEQFLKEELPEIEEFMQLLPNFPLFKLNDILLRKEESSAPTDDESTDRIALNLSQSLSPSKSLPDCVIGDWLYLGDHSHCKSLDTLHLTGITHILCCSDSIPTYFLNDSNVNIKYSRIPIPDTFRAVPSKEALWNYFYAAKQFIDLCNPSISIPDHTNTNQSGDGDSKETRNWTVNGRNKILVHCECGISRSVSIIIAYLLVTKVMLTSDQFHRFQRIQEGLRAFKRGKKNMYRIRKQETDRVVFMKLNEAYYYIQSCRQMMDPNIGFCKQLEKWEMLTHGKRSTLQDLPMFTSAKHRNNVRLGKSIAAEQSGLFANELCSCVLL